MFQLKSFRIARVSGIDVNVHITFGIVLLLGAIAWGTPYGLAGAIFGALAMSLLFAGIALHELGHSVVAQHFGVRVREIVLMPLGGVAMLDGRPKRPLEELYVAIAGPAVNVVIAAILMLSTTLLGGWELTGEALTRGLSFAPPSLLTLIGWLTVANLGVALFNMLPAFPLDGGRVLRATLAMKRGWGPATETAATIGQGVAVVLGLLALLGGHLMLGLVAVFIYFGAGREKEGERTQERLRHLTAGQVVSRPVASLSPSDRFVDVVRFAMSAPQHDFPVLDRGFLVGVVRGQAIVQALNATTPPLFIAPLAERVPTVDAFHRLDRVARMMSERGVDVVAVFDGGAFLGLLSHADLARASQWLARVERQSAQSHQWIDVGSTSRA